MSPNNNGSNFVISCWLAFKVTFYSIFEKLTEITFHLHLLSNKISFLSYSVFNLLFPSFSSACYLLAATACISYHNLSRLVKHFFGIFLTFFYFFRFLFRFSLNRLLLGPFLALRLGSLSILPLYFWKVNCFFDIF